MLRRFLKLCFFTALVMLVPYYVPIVIFGSELEREPFCGVWFFGLFFILVVIFCIGLLVAAFNYVVDGRC